MASIEQRLALVAREVDQGGDGDRLAAEDDLAAGDPGHVHEVVDQANELPRLPVDDLSRPGDLGVGGIGALQHLHRVGDRKERIAQFVRQHREELVLAAPLVRQRLLRALALLDVDGHAHIAVRPADLVAARHGGGAHPAVDAVVAAQAQVAVEAHRARTCAVHCLDIPGQVVGVHAPEPAVGQKRLAGCLARVVEPGAVQVLGLARRVFDPEQRRDVVGHGAEPQLDFLVQRRRDVALCCHDRVRCTGIVAQRRDGDQDVQQRPALRHAPDHDMPDRGTVADLGGQLQGPAGVARGLELTDVQLERCLLLVRVGLHGAAIPEQDPALEIVDDHGVVGVAQDRGQSPLVVGRLAQRRDLGVGDDHAFDPFAVRPIRQDAAQEPFAGGRGDFPVPRLQVGENAGRVLEQRRIHDVAHDVPQRPAFVGRDQAEQAGELPA